MKRMFGLVGSLVVLALVAGGCTKKSFTEPVKLHDKEDKDGNPIPNTAETLDPHTLTDGYEAYMLYCYACHGEKGDGYGPSAPNMRPPPRNFTRALFKFPGTAFGKLPVDSALDRTMRRGLNGTPMLPWDVPAIERKALIAYLKTLSPRWKEEGVPPEIEISKDPWEGKKTEAIAMGKQVYHVAVGGAGCNGCHRSFATHEEIISMSKAVEAEPAEPMYASQLKQSEYPYAQKIGDRQVDCDLIFSIEAFESAADAEKSNETMKAKLENLVVEVNGEEIARDTEKKEGWDFVGGEKPVESEWTKKFSFEEAPRLRFFGKACEKIKADDKPQILATGIHKLLPPDFTFTRVKTAYPVGTEVNEGELQYVEYTEAMQREDLYRTIGVGIGGAAMPGWKGVLEEDKLWALVYYVQSLVNTRETGEGAALRQKLASQSAWVQPAAMPEPDAGTAAPDAGK